MRPSRSPCTKMLSTNAGYVRSCCVADCTARLLQDCASTRARLEDPA